MIPLPSPEWQRRLWSIFLTVVITACIRKVEPALARAYAVDPVWITRICAIAILCLCFRLADRIPNHEWPDHLRLPARPAIAALSAIAILSLLATELL